MEEKRTHRNTAIIQLKVEMTDYLPHRVVYGSPGLIEQKAHHVVVLRHTIKRIVHQIIIAHHLVIGLRNAVYHPQKIEAVGMVIPRLETNRPHLGVVLVDRMSDLSPCNLVNAQHDLKRFQVFCI